MLARFMRLWEVQFLRYLIASVGALAVDMGSFLGLLAVHLPAGLAAAIAYTLGIVAHWVLLSRSVFEENVATRGVGRTQQKALFLVTTLGGLALTTAIVSAADLAGLDVRATKVFAVGLSFFLNYFIRKHFIFKGQRCAA